MFKKINNIEDIIKAKNTLRTVINDLMNDLPYDVQDKINNRFNYISSKPEKVSKYRNNILNFLYSPVQQKKILENEIELISLFTKYLVILKYMKKYGHNQFISHVNSRPRSSFRSSYGSRHSPGPSPRHSPGPSPRHSPRHSPSPSPRHSPSPSPRHSPGPDSKHDEVEAKAKAKAKAKRIVDNAEAKAIDFLGYDPRRDPDSDYKHEQDSTDQRVKYKAEEQQRKQAEQQRKQAEQQRKQAEEQRKQAEEQQREQQRKQAEAEVLAYLQAQAQQQRKQAEQQRKQAEAEQQQQREQAEEQRKQAEEQRKQVEEQRKQAEQQHKQAKTEVLAYLQAQAQQQRKQAEQQRKQAEAEQQQQREQAEEQRKQAEEQRKQVEEQRKQAEQQQQREQAALARRVAEQQRKQAEQAEEQRKQAEAEVLAYLQAQQQREQAEEQQREQAEEQQRKQAPTPVSLYPFILRRGNSSDMDTPRASNREPNKFKVVDWDPYFEYKKGNIVKSRGSVFKSKTDNKDKSPSHNENDWEKFDKWDETKTYDLEDIVSHFSPSDGEHYIYHSLYKDNKRNNPELFNTFWQVQTEPTSPASKSRNVSAPTSPVRRELPVSAPTSSSASAQHQEAEISRDPPLGAEDSDSKDEAFPEVRSPPASAQTDASWGSSRQRPASVSGLVPTPSLKVLNVDEELSTNASLSEIQRQLPKTAEDLEQERKIAQNEGWTFGRGKPKNYPRSTVPISNRFNLLTRELPVSVPTSSSASVQHQETEISRDPPLGAEALKLRAIETLGAMDSRSSSVTRQNPTQEELQKIMAAAQVTKTSKKAKRSREAAKAGSDKDPQNVYKKPIDDATESSDSATDSSEVPIVRGLPLVVVNDD